MNTIEDTKDNQPKIYVQRLDFYWQSISIFAIVLIMWSIMKGTFDNGTFSISINDPIVILLSIIICASAIALLINFNLKKRIEIGGDYIIIANKYRQKRFDISNISRFTLLRERILRRKETIRVAKIRIKNKRRLMKIKPALYWDEKELSNDLEILKNNFKTISKS